MADALKPIAYQWRYRAIGKYVGEWTDWVDGIAPTLLGASYETEERPLYGQEALEIIDDLRQRIDHMADRDEFDTIYLISVIADIRKKTGVGMKPMLSELADAVAAKITEARADERNLCAELCRSVFAVAKGDDGKEAVYDAGVIGNLFADAIMGRHSHIIEDDDTHHIGQEEADD